jgi:hypothetical protein
MKRRNKNPLCILQDMTAVVELKNFIYFSDLAQEPLLAFSSIHSYEQAPLVSLEEATEPLVPIVQDVKQMLRIVEEKVTTTKDNLTINESSSIMLYTITWEPKEQSFAHLLNRSLRSENRDELKPWYLYLKLLMKSLAKLPSIHCYVYRGVQGDFSVEYSQGKTFVWWGFALCTRSIESLESEQAYIRSDQRTRFKIECKSGKDIRNHSFYSADDEILLLSAQRYKVVSSLDSGHGLYIIQIKEIDPNATSSFSFNGDRTSSMSVSLNQRRTSMNISIRDASFCSMVLKLTVRQSQINANDTCVSLYFFVRIVRETI